MDEGQIQVISVGQSESEDCQQSENCIEMAELAEDADELMMDPCMEAKDQEHLEVAQEVNQTEEVFTLHHQSEAQNEVSSESDQI
jgi:hypothetical protein